VIQAPADSGLAPGQRVAAFTALGGMAERAVAPPFMTFALSDALDFGQGAALILNHHTAYFALRLRGRLASGEQVTELSGGGVDVVLDPVGGDRFLDSLRSLREDGRLVVVGVTGGSIPEVRVNRLLLRNNEVVGARGAYAMAKPQLNREIGLELDGMIDAGVLRPVVGARLTLEHGAEALRLIDERLATGKVVLEPTP